MENVKSIHLTGAEIGGMISLINELIDLGSLKIDNLNYDEDKATIYKIRSVRDEKHYKMIVTEE